MLKAKSKTFGLFLAALTLIFTATLTVFTTNTFAAVSDYSSEYKKAIATQLYRCYKAGDFRTPTSLQVYDDYSGVHRFMGGNTTVAMPNGYGMGTSIGCQDLVSKLIAEDGYTIPDDNATASAKKTFLENLGYKSKSDSSSGKCVAWRYKITPTDGSAGRSENTYALCAAAINSNGAIGVDKLGRMENGGTETAVQFEVSSKESKVTLDCKVGLPGRGDCGSHTFKKGETKWDDFVKEITNDLLTNNPRDTSIKNVIYEIEPDTIIQSNYGDVSTSFEMPSDGYKKGLKYLTGYSSLPKFTDSEIFALYQSYLKNVYHADIKCDLTQNEITSYTSQGYKQIRYYDGGSIKEGCVAKATANETQTVNGVNSGKIFGEAKVSFDDITGWMAGSSVSSNNLNNNSNLKVDAITQNPATSSGDDTEDGESDANCFDGAAALGWIICTVIDAVGNATEKLYDNVVEPFLAIDANEFFDRGNSVYSSWQTFQTFANIAFAIMILVVVISQVTGIGIDNLGIKRILPRLIVSAVLINASFLICQLAVDVSNILGSGLNGLFDAMAQQVAGSNISVELNADEFGTADGEYGITSITADTSAILSTVVGGIIAYQAIMAQGFLVLLPLLLGLISALISILFIFILLAARQAGVVILTVLSPVAFVLYMLPNTKSIFDRWVKAFEGLLLLYPICGLLIGGGNFVGAVLLSVAGGKFFMTLAAMLVTVVPFFFIPTLLRNSFSALGNIGATISGIGRNVSRGVTGGLDRGLRNSERVKEYQKNRTAWDQERRAAGVVRRLGNRDRDSLSDAQKRSLGSAYAVLNRGRRETLAGLSKEQSTYENYNEDAVREALTKESENERLSSEIVLARRDSNGGENFDRLFYADDSIFNTAQRDYQRAVDSGDASSADNAMMRMRAVASIAGEQKFKAKEFMSYLEGIQGSGENGEFTAAEQNAMEKVARQMVTGDGSKNFRSANAAGFEWASQVNRGETKTGYRTWAQDSKNIDSAIEHHVTSAAELYSQGNGALDPDNASSLYSLASAKGRAQLARIARTAEVDAKQTGGYDETKNDSINKLINRATIDGHYQTNAGGGPANPGGTASQGPSGGASGPTSGGASPTPSSGDLSDGQEVNFHGPQPTSEPNRNNAETLNEIKNNYQDIFDRQRDE